MTFVKILILIAGTNEPSNAAILADAFAEGAKEVPGTEVTRVRIADLSLAHFRLGHYDPATPGEPDFERVEREVLHADGVLIATPIWNFSVPAHLKNLIDRMGAFALDRETRSIGTLEGKPFFFLYTGGAPMPAWKGLMRFTTSHLPEAIRYFHGTVVGRYYEPKAMKGRGIFGVVADRRTKSLERVRRKGRDFARFVESFQRTRTLPLRFRIITWLYYKGQIILGKFF